MIIADSLRKSFLKKGRKKVEVAAVKNVSFTAENGKITGLLGANGAGKSTTLRLLSGLLSPDRGSAKIDQWHVAKDKLAARKSIGYLPHNAGIYPRMTARENIEYFALLSGMSKTLVKTRVSELIAMLSMEDIAERRSEGFSQGQRTKVALVRALVHKPRNLILDEPTNGLDIMATRKLRKILKTLREQGHCILISSHIMQEITLLCDNVAIINEGETVMENSVHGILNTTGQQNFENAFVVAIGQSLEVD